MKIHWIFKSGRVPLLPLPFALILLVILITCARASKVSNAESVIVSSYKKIPKPNHLRPLQRVHNSVGDKMSNNVRRLLDFGQNRQHQQQNQRPGAGVPDEIQISSNPIVINRFNRTPSTPPTAPAGNRNHRKRQIVIQDATQYLASQGLLPGAADQLGFQAVAAQNYYVQPQMTDMNSAATLLTAASPMPAAHAFGGSPVTDSPLSVQPVSGTVAPQTQIYMLQPDGNSYAPVSFATATAASVAQQQHQGFQQRLGEPIKITPIVEERKEQDIAVPVSSPVKPKVTVVHHSDAKQEHAPVSEDKAAIKSEPSSSSSGQARQSSQESQQQQGQSILLPGASTIIQANNPIEQQQLQQQYELQQQQVLPAIPQPYHMQPHLQPPPGQAYVLHQPHQQPPPQPQSHQPMSASNFVIRQQTYVNPSGQMFTVPVPIPQDQFGPQQHHHPMAPTPHRRGEPAPDDERAEHKREDEDQGDEGIDRVDNNDEHFHEQSDNQQNRQELRPMNSFMHRILDSLAVSRKTKERVEQNIYLPVLASSGVVLGLGALAAGWYLSQANREVGVLRRTGRPFSSNNGPNVKRVRRNAPGPAEIDQAQFFQTIIQQAIEKQQQEFEESEPATSSSEDVQVSLSLGGTAGFGGGYGDGVRKEKVHIKPHAYEEKVEYIDHKEHPKKSLVKHHHHHYKPLLPKKHKKKKRSRQAINFAKVAIPAVTVGGSVIFIAGLILYWYFSGNNREIAFLEPSAYSRRRKRSLSYDYDDGPSSFARATTKLLGDGWLHRIISAIHENPFDEGAPASSSSSSSSPPHSSSSTSTNTIDMLISPGGAFASSKYNDNADISSALVAVSLAVIALLALLALLFAWFLAEGGNAVGSNAVAGWPNAQQYRLLPHSRKTRAANNDLTAGLTSDPNFLEKILSNLEVSQNSLISKLQQVGYREWQETSCAKRIFCDVMSSQSDDTVKVMEKRMVTFISMLPSPSFSNSLSKSLGDVMYSIQKKDCSAYTCGGHPVDPSTTINQASHQYQPRRTR